MGQVSGITRLLFLPRTMGICCGNAVCGSKCRFWKIPYVFPHEALIKRVLESQRRRRFLKNIMRDQSISWDYQQVENGGDAYIRNTMPIYQLEKKSRFPQV